MQVFEFHFNPLSRNASRKEGLDLMFDSFSYEPANISEKRLGGLYMAGILKNVLPQDVGFLENLAKIIKERYYKTVLAGPEKNLKDALKRANEYLEAISKKGDVSWLGNLGFVALTAVKSNLYFTKVGETKVYLLRSGQIIDIDHKLDTEGIEPYPLKVFGNIISGKLSQNDIILILTKDIADVFLKENILAKIAKLSFTEALAKVKKKESSSTLPSSGTLFKSLKEIFSLKKEQLLKTSGVCMAISCGEKPFSRQKETLTQLKNLRQRELRSLFGLIPFYGNRKKFSLRGAFLPIADIVKEKLKIKFPKLKFGIGPRLASLFLRDKSEKNRSVKHSTVKKNAVLVLSLILFLSFGYLVFQKREEAQLKTYQTELNKIQEKMNQAEIYLRFSGTNPRTREKANALFRESWEEISPLTAVSATLPAGFANQITAVQNNILKNLYDLNKLETIKDPSLFIEIKPREFVPQKIVFFQDNLYVFNSYAKNLFEINQKREGHIITLDKKIDFAYAEPNSLLLLSKPNELIVFKNGRFQSPFLLEPPSVNFNFSNFASYLSNLYFTQENEIIKYQLVKENKWDSPQSWLNPKIKIATDFKSMATDGSIWILTKENAVKKYYLGNLERTISLETFPDPKDLTKIFASPRLPYLYLLEPSQQRIIIADKIGNVVKQFQSEKFDNLIDFTVSADGKSIYLLNGQKIYKISFAS